MALIITDANYNRILTPIGYPIVSATDLGLTDDQIKELFILPVLTDVYFVYFPLTTKTQSNIESNFTIDFPSSDVFGVIDARLNTRPYSGGAKTANPIINDLIITVGGRSQKMWGTQNDYGYTQVKIMDRIERDAVIEDEKAVKIMVDTENRQVTGFTNTYGALAITWARYSEDFSKVDFRRRDDLIRLCQARLMEYVGMLREQAVNDLPTELSGTEFLQTAENYRTEIIDKWKAHTKVVIMR